MVPFAAVFTFMFTFGQCKRTLTAIISIIINGTIPSNYFLAIISANASVTNINKSGADLRFCEVIRLTHTTYR